MRKEVIFAIIAGAVFGLIIAVGFWKAKSIIKPNQDNSSSSASNDVNPVATAGLLDLVITLPEDESVVGERTVTVTGSTLPNTLVAVSTESDDFLIYSDADGEFSIDTKAISGVNEIITVSVDSNNNSVEEKIVFVYSSQLDSNKSEPDDEETATDSADEVRQKVQERIDEALNNPKAYIGSVTDISEDTLQISKAVFSKDGSNGEIVQVSVTEDNTDFVDVGENENKTITYDDVAIGDFIIAMGITDENDVLEAQRVLVSETIEPTSRSVTVGNISKVDESEDAILLSSLDGTILTGRSTDFLTSVEGEIEDISFSELERDASVIVITDLDDGKVIARTIYLIPSANQFEPSSDSETTG